MIKTYSYAESEQIDKEELQRLVNKLDADEVKIVIDYLANLLLSRIDPYVRTRCNN